MKNILIIFLVLIIINVIYRLVNYYINPFNFFQGQDKIMNDSWDYSYGIGLLTLSDECDNLGDIIKNYVKSKYKNPKSIFRVKRNNKRYYYSNISINQILKNNFIEIDDNDIDFYKIYEDIKNKKLEWSYYYGKRKFLFVGHHTLFDGVSALNNSIGFFTNFKKFNSNISGNYIPIIDEFNILRSLPNLLNISKKINIHNYVKWETPLSQFKPKIINNSIPVSKIKNLKSKYKVNFIDVLVGYIFKNVFKKFKNNYLNIEIIVAFKSNNRFNNFGIVIIRIKNQDNIKKMILDINKKK